MTDLPLSSRRSHKALLIINALLGGLIGAAIGISLGNLVAASIIGALLGLGTAWIYERLAGKWRQRLYSPCWLEDRALELYTDHAAPLPFKELVKRIAPRPMLFIFTGQAEYETSLAQHYAANARPDAEAWDLPDVGHVAGILARREEYTQKMLDFFDQHFR